jgi:hypothetical protein
VYTILCGVEFRAFLHLHDKHGQRVDGLISRLWLYIAITLNAPIAEIQTQKNGGYDDQ